MALASVSTGCGDSFCRCVALQTKSTLQKKFVIQEPVFVARNMGFMVGLSQQVFVLADI